MCVGRTRGQQDDGGDDERADEQDDQQGDGDPLPVPLRRTAPHQLLPNTETNTSPGSGYQRQTHRPGQGITVVTSHVKMLVVSCHIFVLGKLSTSNVLNLILTSESGH